VTETQTPNSVAKYNVTDSAVSKDLLICAPPLEIPIMETADPVNVQQITIKHVIQMVMAV